MHLDFDQLQVFVHRSGYQKGVYRLLLLYVVLPSAFLCFVHYIQYEPVCFMVGLEAVGELIQLAVATIDAIEWRTSDPTLSPCTPYIV